MLSLIYTRRLIYTSRHIASIQDLLRELGSNLESRRLMPALMRLFDRHLLWGPVSNVFALITEGCGASGGGGRGWQGDGALLLRQLALVLRYAPPHDPLQQGPPHNTVLLSRLPARAADVP